MFRKLRIFQASDAEKIPDALNEIDELMTASDDVLAARRAQIVAAAEALKKEEQERAFMEVQRKFIEDQMTVADRRARLMPEFNKARRRYQRVAGMMSSLQTTIAINEKVAESTRLAYNILLRQVTRVAQARMDYAAAINQLTALGLSPDEAKAYQDELAAPDHNMKINRDNILAGTMEARDALLKQMQAELDKIFNE
jgi:hypothetical protein